MTIEPTNMTPEPTNAELAEKLEHLATEGFDPVFVDEVSMLHLAATRLRAGAGEVSDADIGRALEAFNALAGYSKIEKMRAAISTLSPALQSASSHRSAHP